MMMYTLDLSGHDEHGKAGINRFGGLFLSIEDAFAHGKTAAIEGRFAFHPEVVWIRNEEGNVVRQNTV